MTLTFPELAEGQPPGPLKPPVAKKLPKDVTVQGDKRLDDYFWLRDKTNPDVTRYLESENAYTDEYMKPTVPFQASLYKEMLGRIKQTDLGVPYRLRGAFFHPPPSPDKPNPHSSRHKDTTPPQHHHYP